MLVVNEKKVVREKGGTVVPLCKIFVKKKGGTLWRLKITERTIVGCT